MYEDVLSTVHKSGEDISKEDVLMVSLTNQGEKDWSCPAAGTREIQPHISQM